MKVISKYLSTAILTLTCLGGVNAQETTTKFPLIPYPAHLTAGEGAFKITSKTGIVTSNAFNTEAYALKELLRIGLGKPIEVSKVKKAHAINLVYDASITEPEAYNMSVTKDRVVIRAKDPAGVFHAVETIRQLLPVGIEAGAVQKQLSLPVVAIEDAPVYGWRGMHLDVSRHFFSVSYLKKYIDRMALYKMNKLHLHLTDDQGWRIQIKKYPLLTEAGA